MLQDDKLPSLDDLDKSIQAAKQKANPKQEKRDITGNPSDAMRVAIELVAGVLLGCVLGYWLDRWLGTSPIFFLFCFIFGVAGSGLNIYRMTQNFEDNDKSEEK